MQNISELSIRVVSSKSVTVHELQSTLILFSQTMYAKEYTRPFTTANYLLEGLDQ